MEGYAIIMPWAWACFHNDDNFPSRGRVSEGSMPETAAAAAGVVVVVVVTTAVAAGN